MKRNNTVLFLIFACIIGLFACKTAEIKSSASEDSGFLEHPGFESSKSMKSWMVDGNAAILGVSSEQKHGRGKYSFKIGNAKEESPNDAWAACYQTAIVPNNSEAFYPVKAGETFVFEAWVKGDEGYDGLASIKLEFFAHDRRTGYGSGPIRTVQCDESISYAGDWKKLSVTAQAPDGAVSVVAVLINEKMIMGSEGVYFDNCSLSVK